MIRIVSMFGRATSAVTIIALLLISRPASAGNCLSRAEDFQLTSDAVHWTFAIHTGSECLQGLRGRAMLIDDIKLVEPPSAGSLAISGSGFIYKAPAREANDHFKLRISGENNRMRGTSEVVVDISVRQ